MRSFPFELSGAYVPVLVLAGVIPGRAAVRVGPDRLTASFGFFRVETPLENVAGVEVHPGPFNPLKAIGVRYSFADGSVTFGSSTGPMVEISFESPVTVRPPGLTRHPALWVSVVDPSGLQEALRRSGSPAD